jgi:hypothetical protein
MKCTEARSLFSLCLDDAATGAQRHEIALHVESCPNCQSEYSSLRMTQSLLASLTQPKAPADLALRIQLALSHERSRNLRSFMESWSVRLENACSAFMFPATVGLIAAIFFFGGLFGTFVPAQAQAGTDDILASFYTPPRLESSAYMDTLPTLDSSVVLETDVDANGQVQDYRILSGRNDEEIRQQLNRALLFTKFVPAQAFGRRVPGKAVISFSHINVKG